MASIFTDDLIINFFHEDVHMDLTEATAYALVTEGIEHPRDLGEFSKEDLDSAFKKLRYPPKRINYPYVRGVLPDDLVGVLIDVQPFQISEK